MEFIDPWKKFEVIAPAQDIWVGLILSQNFAIKAWEANTKKFEEIIKKKGFILQEGLYGQKYAVREMQNNLFDAYVFRESGEGALVRGLNSCGATLSRNTIYNIESQVYYTPDNLETKTAKEGLIRICEEYVEIIDSFK